MWGFERPWGLSLLALVLLVLVRSWQAGVPAGRLLGTLRFWPDQDLRGEDQRRRIPPARWALAAAMGAAVLGLAGPKWGPEAQPVQWRVIVDRSPSMGLPLDGAQTRLDGALELLGDHLVGDVLFIAGDAPALEHTSPRPPMAWDQTGQLPEPDWTLFDTAGTVWLTDKKPDRLPLRASLVWSGGAVVPGVVSRDSSQEIIWSPQGETVRASQAEPFHVKLVGDPQSPILVLARMWAEIRGHGLVGDSPALIIECPKEGALASGSLQAVAQSGWAWGGFLTVPANGTPWAWAQPSGQPWVAWVPGRVEITLVGEGAPGGDREGMARDLAGLWDRACLGGPGVITARERAGAGTAGAMGPLADGTLKRSSAARDAGWMQALLAAGAAAFGCLALVLSRGRRL